ncbi:MAG TPA: hypothetical protein QGF58_09365 [Myxococcota bacterium]|nr:hypothetical protein [Myxococcota bacterium]
MALILFLACGTSDPVVTDQAPTSTMSTALRSIQSGETPNVAPEAERPEIPEAARREESAPETATTTAKSPKECRAAKAQRQRQEERIDQQRGGVLASAESRISRARTAMSACVGDQECAIDGKRVMALQEAIVGAEASYENAYEQIGVLEAELFEIDQQIRNACGQPDR